MPAPRVEQLKIPREQRLSGRGSRLWREWCFVRVAFRHFRKRFFLMAAILLGGCVLFMICEPEKHHSLPRAIFFSWALVFGETPEEFPHSYVLRGLFFLMPILGLTVIIEGIIDFALMLRDRRRYERSWCTMLASSFSDHIVLVGFGKLGYRAFLVLRKLGEAVVVIERDPNCQFLDELRRDGNPLLIGDARRDALLLEANTAKARSIILATDDDLANLEIALDAQRMNPNIRVVVRMFDQTIADKMSAGFNIDMAMSPSAISAPTFATSAVAPAIVGSFIVGDQLVAMQRWLIRRNGLMVGLTVGEVTARFGFGVVEQRLPNGQPRLFPTPDTRLEPGDGIVLQGPLHALKDLWNRDGAPEFAAAATISGQ
jgi:voltage-gated potassium channel Kch